MKKLLGLLMLAMCLFAVNLQANENVTIDKIGTIKQTLSEEGVIAVLGDYTQDEMVMYHLDSKGGVIEVKMSMDEFTEMYYLTYQELQEAKMFGCSPCSRCIQYCFINGVESIRDCCDNKRE